MRSRRRLTGILQVVVFFGTSFLFLNGGTANAWEIGESPAWYRVNQNGPGGGSSGIQSTIVQIGKRTFHYDSSGHLVFDDAMFGSGAFYGANTIATAAHVIINDQGTIADTSTYVVKRARNGAEGTAAQVCMGATSASGSMYIMGRTAGSSYNVPADWAAFRVQCATSTGVMPLYTAGVTDLRNKKVWGTGFPQDSTRSGQMWEDFGTVSWWDNNANGSLSDDDPVNTGVYRWFGDFLGGSSGGPMFSNVACGQSIGYCEYGIISGQTQTTAGTTQVLVNLLHALRPGEVGRMACFRDNPGSSC